MENTKEFNNNHTAIPNDLIDKYITLFKEDKQMEAIFDLIRQSYKAGLEIGRAEECEHCKKLYD